MRVRLHVAVLMVIVFGFTLAVSAAEVWAGVQDLPGLASCEMAAAKGTPIVGSVGVSIDKTFGTASVTFKTVSLTGGLSLEVIRGLVALTLLVGPMETVCEVLLSPTENGVANPETGLATGPTLAQQILQAVGMPNRTIKITKRGIFGCDQLPCANPGLKPDFATIPGSLEAGLPTDTGLGTVILYAVK